MEREQRSIIQLPEGFEVVYDEEGQRYFRSPSGSQRAVFNLMEHDHSGSERGNAVRLSEHQALVDLIDE